MTIIFRNVINLSFVVILLIPVLVTFTLPAKEISLSENRKLADFPQFKRSSFTNGDFKKQFEQYWNDHFGLREKLVSANSYIQQKLFGKSPISKVIKGRDGWLYLNLSSTVSDYLGYSPQSEKTLHSWSQTLKNRESWLNSLGIQYFVLPAPSKLNVYPEYLPARYSFFRKNKSRTRLEQLLMYLDENSGFANIIDLRDAFSAGKTTDQLYFKTDTHWTWKGAYLAYKEVMMKLQRYYPELAIIPISALKLKNTARNGDLARILGTVNYSPESTQTIEIKNSCSSEMFKLPGHNPKTTKRHPMVTTCDKAKLSAVVTYDSFGAFLFPYYSEHFSKVTYVSRYDSVWLKSYLEKERPDVFIHQRVARKLEGILYDSWGLDNNLDQESI